MEEDDLLGGKLGEQDSRHQLLRPGGRGTVVSDRGGLKGRRVENYGGQGSYQGDWDGDRFKGNQTINAGRGDAVRIHNQQGG